MGTTTLLCNKIFKKRFKEIALALLKILHFKGNYFHCGEKAHRGETVRFRQIMRKQNDFMRNMYYRRRCENLY